MNVRFDPFRELDRVANVAFDGTTQGSIPIDVVRSPQDVRILLDLPGVDAGSIDLTAERNRLTIKATRTSALADGERLVIRERPAGDFTRTLVLSEGLDASRISASYDQGVLTIAVPVAEMARARKLTIQVGQAPLKVSGAPQILGEVSEPEVALAN